MNCPNCHCALTETKTGLGIVWSCAQCGGRAVGFELLRRTVNADFMNDLWQKAMNEAEPNGKICPSCSLTMKQVTEQDVAEPVTIDLCQHCHFLWFDAHEIEDLPILPPNLKKNPDAQLPPKAREALAMEKMKMIAEQARQEEWKDSFSRSAGNYTGNYLDWSVTSILYDLVRGLFR